MKHAIVTGGGGGLGQSICKTLSENGYTVAVVDLKLEDSQNTAGDLENATAHAADVRRETSVKAMYNEIGQVPDLIVNNAGIARFGKLLDQKSFPFKTLSFQNILVSVKTL